jgi:hypothetical protein
MKVVPSTKSMTSTAKSFGEQPKPKRKSKILLRNTEKEITDL